MLALIGLDATPMVLLDELASEGLVPRIAELRQAASSLDLTTPATFFPAGAFPTLSIRRHGVGSGRSGNHTEEAWALVLPSSGAAPDGERRDLCDIAATALRRFDLDAAGTTLIERS